MYRFFRKIFVKINDTFGIYTGIKVKKVTYSRPSTLKAKELFAEKEIRVLEIGCASGNNSLDVLKTLNVSEYIIIDPYDTYDDSYNDYSVNRLSKMRKESKDKLSPYSKIITWIYDYSENAVKKINGKIDYIYIDGNHSYHFVKSDMSNYAKLLADTYVFGGHDINLPDVSKAFVEFVFENNCKCFEINDPDWIIYSCSN